MVGNGWNSNSTQPKSQTVKAGKSTINIRDDGSTIHYESDTAIDLFDFLDFLSGGYGCSEYGLNLDGGKPNAFLHIYLAANMTDILGEKEARDFLTAHETYTVSEYADGAMFSQDDIDTDLNYDKTTYNKAYPTRQQHAAMDLQNNETGIQIALNTPTDPVEIEKELITMSGQGETLESLREQFPNHTDRQILFIKKAVQAVESGEAAIIWDYPSY